MNTGLTHFKKGNKAALAKAGKKHIKTLFKESLQASIKEFDEKLFELTDEFLNSRNQKLRFLAWKEIVRYRLPRLHRINGEPEVVRIILKKYGDTTKYEDEDNDESHNK